MGGQQLPGDPQHPHPGMLQGVPGGHYPAPGGMHGMPMQTFGAQPPGVGPLGQYGAPQHMAMPGMMPQGPGMGQPGLPLGGYPRGPDGVGGVAGGHHGHGAGHHGLAGQGAILAAQLQQHMGQMGQMGPLGMGAGPMHPYQGIGSVAPGMPLQPGLVGLPPGHGGPPMHGQMPSSMMMTGEAADMAGGVSQRRPGAGGPSGSSPDRGPRGGGAGDKMGPEGGNSRSDPYSENSGGSQRQGGATGHTAPGRGSGDDGADGDNQDAMAGDGSFPDAGGAGGPTGGRSAAGQESATTRGGKKPKGGSAVGNARTKKQEKEEEK